MGAGKPADFDISQWLPMFPLGKFKADAILSSCGPGEVCYTEQIRQRARKIGDLGESKPTDVFVCGYGEPSSRDTTKLGGLPYRPAGAPWPTSKETGEPLAFLAQFRFTESLDLFDRELPGSILLVFIEDAAPACYDKFKGPPVFEWYPLGMDDLVRSEEIPRQEFEIGISLLYTERFRTCDYLDEAAIDTLFRAMPRAYQRGRLPPYTPSDAEELEEWKVYCRLFHTQLATFKIGGVPFWRFPDIIERNGIEPGMFLATIPQFYLLGDGPYPLLNVPEEDGELEEFMWTTDGVMHLFLDDDANVVPRFDAISVFQPPQRHEQGNSE